jgi:hypothetical protein
MCRSPTSSVSYMRFKLERCSPPVAKWLGRQSYLDDLNSLDKELYKGLISEYNSLSLMSADGQS